MSIRVKVGDVFAIPIDDDRCAIGVVASKWHKELLLFVFGELSKDGAEVDVVAVTAQKPIIGSSSLDAKLWHGHWPIIGHVDSDFSSMQPVYKVQTPDGWIAESFDRRWRSSINARAAEGLQFRKCVAPVRVERAVRAYFHNEGWEPEFDKLLYESVEESQAIQRAAM